MDRIIELGKKLKIFFPDYIYKYQDEHITCYYLETEYDLKHEIEAAIFYIMMTHDINKARNIINELIIDDPSHYIKLIHKILDQRDELFRYELLLEKMYEYDLSSTRLIYMLYTDTTNIHITNHQLLKELIYISKQKQNKELMKFFMLQLFVHCNDEQMIDFVYYYREFDRDILKEFLTEYFTIKNTSYYQNKVKEHYDHPLFINKLITALKIKYIDLYYGDLYDIYTQCHNKELFDIYKNYKYQTLKKYNDVMEIENLLQDSYIPSQLKNDLYLKVIFEYDQIEHMYDYAYWYFNLNKDLDVNEELVLYCLKETYDRNNEYDVMMLEELSLR